MKWYLLKVLTSSHHSIHSASFRFTTAFTMAAALDESMLQRGTYKAQSVVLPAPHKKINTSGFICSVNTASCIQWNNA